MLANYGTPPHLRPEPVRKKGQKYPTKWKLACETFTGKFLVRTSNNSFPDIRPIKELVFERMHRNGLPERSREEREGHSLTWVCDRLGISDKERALLSLVEGGFKIAETLCHQYDWHLKILEEEESIARHKKKEKKTKKYLELKEKQRLEKLKQKKGFVRKVDP